MRRLIVLSSMFLAMFTGALMMPAAASAPEVGGTWKGAFDFQGSQVPLTIEMKVDGESVTGKIMGMPTDPAEIKEGKVHDSAVTFWVLTNYEGTDYKIVFKGDVAGDEIKFSMGTEDGSWGTDFTAKRQS